MGLMLPNKNSHCLPLVLKSSTLPTTFPANIFLGHQLMCLITKFVLVMLHVIALSLDQKLNVLASQKKMLKLCQLNSYKRLSSYNFKNKINNKIQFSPRIFPPSPTILISNLQKIQMNNSINHNNQHHFHTLHQFKGLKAKDLDNSHPQKKCFRLCIPKLINLLTKNLEIILCKKAK